MQLASQSQSLFLPAPFPQRGRCRRTLNRIVPNQRRADFLLLRQLRMSRRGKQCSPRSRRRNRVRHHLRRPGPLLLPRLRRDVHSHRRHPHVLSHRGRRRRHRLRQNQLPRDLRGGRLTRIRPKRNLSIRHRKPSPTRPHHQKKMDRPTKGERLNRSEKNEFAGNGIGWWSRCRQKGNIYPPVGANRHRVRAFSSGPRFVGA